MGEPDRPEETLDHPADDRGNAIRPASHPANPEATIGPAGASISEAVPALAGATNARRVAEPGETVGAEDARSRPGRSLPVIPGFEIEAEVGRGGMGVVYRARHVRLNRTVAIKMILAGEHAGAEASARFLAEAESIARLQHPNIVQIHHIDEHEGRPYFEMEYVGGGTLADRLDGQPRPPLPSARLVGQLARAAVEAHRSGIVHRDLKPSNILLSQDGTPKIADFGLAKTIAADSGLTRTDSILGSPSYMAPEQAEGHAREVGPAADVYALGAILYEQLTGRPPFVGATVLDTLQQVKSADPVAPSRLVPGLPRDVETIALKCLEKAPTRRYATAGDLASDLDRFAEGEPIVARPVAFWERGWKWAVRRPAIAALGLALVALSAALLVLGLVSYGRIQAALGQARDEKTRALIAKGEEALARERAEADRARAEADRARADSSREAALAETYRASISEARALRAAHQSGWRDAALGNIARLATLPTPRRDLVELRTEAVACLGDFDIREVARVDTSQGAAFGLDFLADGPTLVTAHRNGVVHLWDAAGLSHRAALLGEGPVGSWDLPSAGEPFPIARRRPDGKGLFCNPKGHGAVSLGPDLKPDRPPIDRDGMSSKALCRDGTGRRLAIGWLDNRVDVYDLTTGSRLASVATADGMAAALSPDGRWLALVGSGNTILLRPVDGSGPAIPLGSHREAIRSVAFSPDGATLATASHDHSVILWDVARREARFPLRGHKGAVTQVVYSPDGEWIVTGSVDFTVRVWDSRSGRELAVLPHDQSIAAVAFSPGGDYLATTSIYTRWSQLYRISGRRERRRLAGHSSHVKSIAYNPKRARLATGDEAGQLGLWDSTSGALLRKWQGHPASLNSLAFSPDGSILASGDWGANLRLWDAESGSLLRELPGHRNTVTALAFDRAGARLFAGESAGRVLVHEVASGTNPPTEVAISQGWIHDIALTGDERGLLIQSNQGRLTLAALTRDAPARSSPSRGLLTNLVFDPVRSRAIIGESSGALVTVSVPSLEPGARVGGIHQERITRMALSPDGKLVASGSADGQLVLSDSASLRPLLKFPRRTGSVQALAFDSNETQVAIGGLDAEVEVWDLGLLRAGLEAVGLAWDRPAPTVEPGSDIGPLAGAAPGAVPMITEDGIDPAEKARALELRRSGVQALQANRAAEAVAPLRDAVERYRRFARARPDDPRAAGFLANNIGWLGGALAAAGRQAEARAATVESRTILEGLATPTPNELYDLACAYSRLSAATPAVGGEVSLADRAVATLIRSVEAGLRAELDIAGDPDFDPIRGRADFQALLLDRKFPRNPFASP